MAETSTIVREARADDAAVLAALMTELGYPTEEQRAAQRLTALFTSADDVVFVAVTADGAVVGFVHAAERRLLVSDRFVEMEGLIVTAAARRGGAAAGLVAAVEAWTLARGVPELRVRARIERDVAERFYRGRGFSLAKQQRLFVKALRALEHDSEAPSPSP
jgi:N-acetylglutamate synthase-like GNAT family acetyltransferase